MWFQQYQLLMLNLLEFVQTFHRVNIGKDQVHELKGPHCRYSICWKRHSLTKSCAYISNHSMLILLLNVNIFCDSRLYVPFIDGGKQV